MKIAMPILLISLITTCPCSAQNLSTARKMLNELAADFSEVRFVAWARYSSKVRKFRNQYSESNFRFVADKWQKLGQWTKVFGGTIVLIVNKKGQLEYKNRIFEDHPIFKAQLQEAIREKLDELI